MKCFWESGCSDSARCREFGQCVASWQNAHKDDIRRTPSAGEATPCPFCGGRAEYKEGVKTRYVMCLKCEVMGPNLPEQEAVAAWNQRATGTPSSAAENEIERYRQALRDVAQYTGEGPSTTPWQDIVRSMRNTALAALQHPRTVSATRFGRWHPISDTPEPGIYIARDKDGQMTFASLDERYGWEHVCDDDCGELVEWTPLPAIDSARDSNGRT